MAKKAEKRKKNNWKTCVFFLRGRSRDKKILDFIYYESTIIYGSDKKKLGPYL